MQIRTVYFATSLCQQIDPPRAPPSRPCMSLKQRAFDAYRALRRDPLATPLGPQNQNLRICSGRGSGQGKVRRALHVGYVGFVKKAARKEAFPGGKRGDVSGLLRLAQRRAHDCGPLKFRALT